MSLTDKLVLVTGASRGIGASVLETLASQGAIVIGTATSAAGAEKIQAKLDELGAKGKGLALNVTEQSSIDDVFGEIKQSYGKLPEILVNNAGITRDNLMLRMKDDEWDDVINTNLSGVYKVTKASIKAMVKARFGRIINIGSVSGVMGNPGQVNYSAAKAGLIGFSKSLAKEVASRGITVNVVAPGFVETDMTSYLSEDEAKAMKAGIPAGRFATPAEISAVVSFLASDSAGYITGQTININGGLHM